MLTHHSVPSRHPDRVVVLGARGFLARALIARLESAKLSVRAIGSGEIDLTGEQAADRLAGELKAGDCVVFLSALTPDKGRGTAALMANLRMAAAVCNALERQPVAHVVYLSSDAVYPFRAALVDESSAAEPSDLYATMHMTRELMVKQSVKSPLAVLRPTLIYGAADTHNSYGPNRLRRMAKKDNRITLFGNGEETRDHIYIDDVATLIDLVIGHRSSGTLNLATGRSVSFADLAAMVAKLFDKPIEIVTTPRQNAATYRAFDISALHRAFPTFNFMPLERGLAEAHRDEMK